MAAKKTISEQLYLLGIEWIAERDHVSEVSISSMRNTSSVQLLAHLFSKSAVAVAGEVLQYRRRGGSHA